MKKQQTSESEQTATAEPTADQPVTGRSVFLIETVAAGVSVRTAFLSEQEQLLQMPAVFPNLSYALDQIEQLKRRVIEHFEQAAQIGAQVISEHARQSATSAEQPADNTEPTNDA